MERLDLYIHKPEELLAGEDQVLWVWIMYLAGHKVKIAEDLIINIISKNSQELDYLFGYILTEEFSFVNKVREYWEDATDTQYPQGLIHNLINSELEIKPISSEIDFQFMINNFDISEKAILNLLIGG